MTDDELGNALKSLLPGTEKAIQLLGNSCNGANVVLCTEKGYKVCLHEVLVRRFTNLLDAFDLRLTGNWTWQNRTLEFSANTPLRRFQLALECLL